MRPSEFNALLDRLISAQVAVDNQWHKEADIGGQGRSSAWEELCEKRDEILYEAELAYAELWGMAPDGGQMTKPKQQPFKFSLNGEPLDLLPNDCVGEITVQMPCKPVKEVEVEILAGLYERTMCTMVSITPQSGETRRYLRPSTASIQRLLKMYEAEPIGFTDFKIRATSVVISLTFRLTNRPRLANDIA